MEEMHPEMRPKLKPVDAQGKPSMDCLDLTQSVIDNPSISVRDKLTAAAILAPYKHSKAEGHRLKLEWNDPPPRTIDEAIEYSRKILEFQVRGVITDIEADKLRAGVQHLAQLLGWGELAQRIEALEAKAEIIGPQPVQIAITGGLPVLPGNEATLIMPDRKRSKPTPPTFSFDDEEPANGAGDTAQQSEGARTDAEASGPDDPDTGRPPGEDG
jgi:hypothetical protein